MGSPIPDKTIAEGSGSDAIAGRPRSRGQAQLRPSTRASAGGVGGRNGEDGASATSLHLSNGKIAPSVETIESEFPTQVERFELLRDSGRHRGGPGFGSEYRILQEEVRFSMRTDEHALAPQGIDGGHPGGGTNAACHPASADRSLQSGDVLRVERPGGDGVGAAFERSPDAVLDDVRRGTFRWRGFGVATGLSFVERALRFVWPRRRPESCAGNGTAVGIGPPP